MSRRGHGRSATRGVLYQVAREIDKFVRDRDRWKRRALDRAAVRSPDRKREIDARDKAARAILFLASVEGVRDLSLGGRGCLWEALQALRPDITVTMGDGLVDDAHDALHRFFPTEDDLKVDG